MKLYKVIDENNRSCNGGEFDWTPYLPTDKPGKWTPKRKIDMCKSGWHVTDAAHLLNWLDAQIFECEVKGGHIEGDDKSCYEQIRLVRKLEAWNDKSARLYACWCVRRVWHLLTDERSRNVVEVAERYANGLATDAELAAAWAAAWAAARDAAWDAARAAGAAAGDAAWGAVWAAARDAARDAARAAGAAGDAAWDARAAWAAAWAAARDAAWAAARAAQSTHLIEILGLEE